MRNVIGRIIAFPFKVLWFLIKVVATIFLLFLGPPGWAFIAGWWYSAQKNKPHAVYLVDSDGKRISANSIINVGK